MSNINNTNDVNNTNDANDAINIDSNDDNWGKFRIVCMHCGSDDTSVEDVVEYDWDENPYVDGHYFQCNNCDSNNR